MTGDTNGMAGRRPLVVDIGPLRERFYTGIPNVIAELCARFLREDWLDLYFEMDERWIDNDSVRRCLDERSGVSLADRPERFRPARAIRDALREAGLMPRTVGLYTDLRPPRKLYPREGKIVYDLSMVLTPECHPPHAHAMFVHDLAEQIACSDVLFCISEATARDLAWIYGVGAERLRVALLGNNVDPTAAERMRTLLQGRPVEPFLLVLGSIEPRKNAVLVLRWLAEHPEVLEEVRVVFAGRQAWGQSFTALVEACGLQQALDAGRIVFTSYVDEAFRTALLVGAAGLIYPSVLEGFGLPLLEAMATGTPVMSSVSSSMPEVVGECGYYFDPCSVASLHAAWLALRADRASGAVATMTARAGARAGGFSYDSTYEVIVEGLFGLKWRANRIDRRATRQPPARTSIDEADINVIGYLRAAMGLGEAGRLTLRTLSYAGLKARGLETSLNSNSRRTDRSCDTLLEPGANGRFQLFSINCDQLPQVLAHLQPVLRADAYRIMAPFWELSNLPDAWLPAVDEVDEIWAPTRFIQAMLTKKVGKPVLHMPLALDFEQPAPFKRRRFGLPEGEFLFFFAFDYFSFIERKNPMAVIKAFKRAFRSGGERGGTQLVLKTLNADVLPEAGAALRDLVRDDPDIFLIESLLSRQDTLGLIAACDAVVTLHRSEGLGLLVAEAMVLGKPVISTDYSATMELVTPVTGWPVDYKLIPVQAGEYPFHAGQVWADVDVDHAAWQMRQVKEDPVAVQRKVVAARELIARDFSLGVVAQRQLERLKLLDERCC
nr:glycosyltransferase [uncultured Lichenicoccus sp.]